ncbi:MAG: PAS domain S-box protein [Rhodocyclaceae bacterium]|nr:PAS domain S-box protein [Rhodocyclaceae bacterium]
MTITGILLVSAPLLSLAVYGWRQRQAWNDRATRPKHTLPVLAMLLLVPLIVAMMTFIRLPQLEQETFASLTAVAELKAGQVDSWLHERHADAEILLSDSHLTAEAQRFARAPQGANAALILQRFNRMRELYGYKSIMLLDSTANVLLSDGDAQETTPELLAGVRKAFQTGTSVRTEPFLSAESGTVQIDWIVPLIDKKSRHAGESKSGRENVIVLRQTMDETLFPMMQSWPVASPSGETLLVTKIGSYAVYMNELRFKKNTALRLKLPTAQRDLPAAVAIRAQKPGTTIGIDYRNQVIQAAYRGIKDTHWLIVTKLDRQEMLAPLWTMMLWVSVILFVAVLIVVLVLEKLWQERDENFQLSLLAEKNKSEQLVQKFFELPFAGMAIIAPNNQRLLQFNQKLCEILGYSHDELTAQNWESLPHPDDRVITREHHEAAMAGTSEGYSLEVRFLTKAGQTINAKLDVRLVKQADGSIEYLVAVIEDITERRRIEHALRDAELRWKYALEGANHGAWDMNLKSGSLFLSNRWKEMLGYAPHEIDNNRETVDALIHPDDLVLARSNLADYLASPSRQQDEAYVAEYRMRCKNGDYCWVMNRGRVIEYSAAGEPLRFLGTQTDITALKHAEARLRRASQFYAALSHCNEHIMRCESRDELLKQVCEDAVIYGGIQMAWVGLVEEDGRVIPVASAGEGLSYLDGLQATSDAYSPYGQGPTGTAVRENHPVWCNNFLQKESTGPWHSRMEERKWQASAALPLQCNNRVVGAFSLYSRDADTFDDAIESLLQEMAVNISFALERFEREAEIAQQKKQMARLLQAVEQSTNTVVITNLEARIEYANPSFERTTGYTLDEVRNRNPRVLQSGKTPRATYEDMWAHLSRGESWKGEFINRRKDGSELTEFVHISPVREADGTITHYLAIKQDITDVKSAQEALAKLNSELEAKVLQRTQELELARQEAEHANLAKSEFLANMSHEIRTPMNAIVGHIQLLRRSALNREQHDQLKKMEGAGAHLLSLINDILDLSKIEAGHLELEQTDFDLIALLDNVYTMMTATAGKKGLALQTQADGVPRSLRGDPTRLRQALINYVSNAVKFTHQGSVTIAVELLEESNDDLYLRFKVSDTGIGIPQEKLTRLFRAFEQADASTTRQYGGTGLGLSITRHFARLMGGEVGCTSNEGEGSTFWFTAHLKHGHSQEPPAVAHPPQDIESALARHAGARILLADDVEINREVIQLLLEPTGLIIDSAENGAQAVALAAMSEYRLVLMDIQMPIMDGFNATQEIHRLPGRESLPVIALTANVFVEDRRRCIEAGMVDFIPKPVSQDELFAKMLYWLEGGDQTFATAVSLPVTAQTTVAEAYGLPNHLPGIDIASGMQVWRETNVYLRFLQHFINDTATAAAEAMTLEEAGDYAALSKLAHKVKGAAGNLALTEVQRIAAEIEAQAKTETTASHLLNEFSLAFERTTASIAALAAMIEAGSAQERAEAEKTTGQASEGLPTGASAREAMPLLKRLLAALDTDAPDEAEQILAKLSHKLPLAALAPISAHLESFDFKHATESALDLLAKLRAAEQGEKND